MKVANNNEPGRAVRTFLGAYVKAITRVNQLVAQVLCVALVLLTIIILYEVGARYLVGKPTTWTYETSKMCFGLLAVWGGGYTFIVGDHINIDLFLSKFSSRKQLFINTFNYLLFIFAVAVLLYLSLGDAFYSIKIQEMSNSTWGQPLYHWRVAVACGLFLLLFQVLAELVDAIWKIIFNESLK